MFDQSLIQAAVTFHHIYQIVYNTVFQTHNHIQVSKADIGVNHDYFFIQHGKAGSYVCRCGGFAYTALPGCDNNNFAHLLIPPKYKLILSF